MSKTRIEPYEQKHFKFLGTNRSSVIYEDIWAWQPISLASVKRVKILIKSLMEDFQDWESWTLQSTLTKQ